MADGRTETRAAFMAHGEQGDLVVKVDKIFYDHGAGPSATALLRVVPTLGDISFFTNGALSLAR